LENNIFRFILAQPLVRKCQGLHLISPAGSLMFWDMWPLDVVDGAHQEIFQAHNRSNGWASIFQLPVLLHIEDHPHYKEEPLMLMNGS